MPLFSFTDLLKRCLPGFFVVQIQPILVSFNFYLSFNQKSLASQKRLWKHTPNTALVYIFKMYILCSSGMTSLSFIIHNLHLFPVTWQGILKPHTPWVFEIMDIKLVGRLSTEPHTHEAVHLTWHTRSQHRPAVVFVLNLQSLWIELGLHRWC